MSVIIEPLQWSSSGQLSPKSPWSKCRRHLVHSLLVSLLFSWLVAWCTFLVWLAQDIQWHHWCSLSLISQIPYITRFISKQNFEGKNALALKMLKSIFFIRNTATAIHYTSESPSLHQVFLISSLSLRLCFHQSFLSVFDSTAEFSFVCLVVAVGLNHSIRSAVFDIQ